MATQQIGTINVRVNSTNPKVTSINYGGGHTLKSSSDLNMKGAQDGDVIVYKSASDSFVVEPIIDTHVTIDNGFF